jgi:hypothetical protein
VLTLNRYSGANTQLITTSLLVGKNTVKEKAPTKEGKYLVRAGNQFT